MRQAAIFAALSALGAVVAQSTSNTTVDASTVDQSLRSSWCNGQFNTCKTLCSQATKSNSCNTATLAFECLCASNSSAPGLQYYIQTMPTFQCEEAFRRCNEENAGDSIGQDACEQNIRSKCGTLDPTKANLSGDETKSGSEPSGSGTASAPGPTSASSTAAAAPTKMAYLGNGVVAVAAGVLVAML